MVNIQSEDDQDFFPGIKYVQLKKEELMEHVLLAKSGNQDSFEKILCHMSGYISYLTKEFFVQGGQRQDLIQECGIKLSNIIKKYNDKKGGFNSFAQGSLRKHILTIISREKAQKRKILNCSYSLDAFLDENSEDSTVYIDTLSSEKSTTTCKLKSQLDIIQLDYEQFLVEEICKVLSEMEGQVFVLRYINGSSYKEIAQQLNLYKTTKTGKVRLDCKAVDNCVWRSKPKIKKVMEKLGIKNTSLQTTEEKLFKIEGEKKKRGRPKKVEEPVKKKRGRPRKIQAEPVREKRKYVRKTIKVEPEPIVQKMGKIKKPPNKKSIVCKNVTNTRRNKNGKCSQKNKKL